MPDDATDAQGQATGAGPGQQAGRPGAGGAAPEAQSATGTAGAGAASAPQGTPDPLAEFEAELGRMQTALQESEAKSLKWETAAKKRMGDGQPEFDALRAMKRRVDELGGLSALEALRTRLGEGDETTTEDEGTAEPEPTPEPARRPSASVSPHGVSFNWADWLQRSYDAAEAESGRAVAAEWLANEVAVWDAAPHLRGGGPVPRWARGLTGIAPPAPRETAEQFAGFKSKAELDTYLDNRDRQREGESFRAGLQFERGIAQVTKVVAPQFLEEEVQIGDSTMRRRDWVEFYCQEKGGTATPLQALLALFPGDTMVHIGERVGAAKANEIIARHIASAPEGMGAAVPFPQPTASQATLAQYVAAGVGGKVGTVVPPDDLGQLMFEPGPPM